MVRKRQIPIQFDPEQIAELDKIREERRIGSARPPYAVIVRELVADALRRRTGLESGVSAVQVVRVADALRRRRGRRT